MNPEFERQRRSADVEVKVRSASPVVYVNRNLSPADVAVETQAIG